MRPNSRLGQVGLFGPFGLVSDLIDSQFVSATENNRLEFL